MSKSSKKIIAKQAAPVARRKLKVTTAQVVAIRKTAGKTKSVAEWAKQLKVSTVYLYKIINKQARTA
jgi:hypothetical protein